MLQDEPQWQRRAALPPPEQPTPTDINVWALVKDFVGKGELSKMATPVQFLEPLSELQQRCEDLEYSELLDQAQPPSSFGNDPRTCWSSAFRLICRART